jgi:tetrapyrrole methylase family protein/MazG family protein
MQGDSALGRAVAIIDTLRRRLAKMGTGDGGRGTGKTSPLLEAYRIQERAAAVGFDWPDATGPMDKVKEELAEVEREEGSGKREALEDEVGDLLFAVVNLSRKLAIDPRAALERANDKFKRRFEGVENLARERRLELGRASLEELDALWDEVKGSP